ncbi:hypothetical protein VCUG_00374, partial [Vavraia culicis subsp. floridensis]
MVIARSTEKKDEKEDKKKLKNYKKQSRRYFDENMEEGNDTTKNVPGNNFDNVLYHSKDNNTAADSMFTSDILATIYETTGNMSFNDSFQCLSYYNHLFKTVFLNHTYFNLYDISYPSDKLKEDLNYYRNTVKKTTPFKIIYNSLISQYISEAQAFFDENSFVEIETIKTKDHYEMSAGGSANSYKNIKITDIKKCKPVEYSNSFIGNQNTIFITDQMYNKLKNKNFVINFTVKELSHLKITKFVDMKAKRLNYREAVELYAYEQLSQDVKGNEYRIYESKSQKIVIMCKSSFKYYNKTKRIYGTPDDASSAEFVLQDDVITPVDVLGKKRNYLDWLNGFDLAEGDYSAVGGKIYRLESEGFVFSAEGFVIEAVEELY